MSPTRGDALATVAGALIGGLVIGATSGSTPARLAVLLIAGALAVTVVGPWLGRREALAGARAVLGLSAGLLVPGLLLAPSWALLGGALWVALFGLALVGLTRLAGRQGQVVATAAGLLLAAWPYVGGSVAAALPPGAQRPAMSATLLGPVPVLGGTFAGADVLRSARLYREFPLGQSLPFSYASPRAALSVAALAAVALAGLALLRARGVRTLPAGGPRVAPALALLLVLAAPGEARAQLFPEATPDSGPVIGDLSTRVQLGYWVPDLSGYVELDAAAPGLLQGSKLRFDSVLELDPIFVMPTFEVSLAWENGGRLNIQYCEGLWIGQATTAPPRNFEEATFPPGSFIETRYRFRTIAFTAELYIPLADFITFRLLTTTRYVKHEIKLRSLTPTIVSERNSLEALMPTIGVGADVMIWQMISAYGDIQWLDFRTSIFGGEDSRWEFSYREAHVGIRLTLVPHAHVMLEWFWLDTQVIDGGREKYRQELMGPRLQVAILF